MSVQSYPLHWPPGGRFVDLTGMVFGLLTVIRLSRKLRTKYYWMCACECGSSANARGEHLKQGRTISCGCKKTANAKAMGNRNNTHGCSSAAGTRTPSPEYRAWKSMKHRCLNPRHKSFARYGGRGISICERWLHSFEFFLADMGHKPSAAHSLDRYPDNDGNYEPTNCRWATASAQQGNKGRETALRAPHD